jgi:putative copper resistance protein D
VSGLVGALSRVSLLADLATGYGALLALKAVLLAGLALLVVVRLRRAPGAPGAAIEHRFLRFAGVELVLLIAGAGLGLAFAGGSPPWTARLRVRSAAESVTGYPMPPPLSGVRWISEWQPDLLWLLVAFLGAVGYLAGARRLHARGARWPVAGTLSWFAGLAGLVYITSGPPVVYGRVLFSMHMLGHMALSMLVPVFLVLAAPVTLALSALPPRGDGTRGPREWLAVAVHSRAARVLSFPPVAAFLFAGSLLFFYFSPLFGLALHTHVGLELMYAHFLIAGYLFAWVLVGLDPGPTRVSHPLRLITLLVAMAFHAFFGVALLSGRTVLAGDYFGSLGRTWGAGLLSDQRLGGGIAWGIGDVPAIVMAVILAIQWARDDDREAQRLDRAADQDGDADLVAYNQMLVRLARTGQGHGPRRE